jgi:hypothetical protein
MLELAAKSYGLTDAKYQHGGDWMEERYGYHEAIYSDIHGGYWNSLADGNDSLNLAVKLKLDIEFHDGDDRTPSGVTANTYKFEFQGASENIALNPSLEHATRRAITRAAAEIGKTK